MTGPINGTPLVAAVPRCRFTLTIEGQIDGVENPAVVQQIVLQSVSIATALLRAETKVAVDVVPLLSLGVTT